MLVELDVNVKETLAGIVHNVLLIVNFDRVSSIRLSFWSLECELVIFLLIYAKPIPVRDSSPTAVATGLRLPYLGRCNSWFRKNFTYPEGFGKIRLCPKRTKVRSDSPPTVTRRCAEVLVALHRTGARSAYSRAAKQMFA